jgi:hypothetical protein
MNETLGKSDEYLQKNQPKYRSVRSSFSTAGYKNNRKLNTELSFEVR